MTTLSLQDLRDYLLGKLPYMDAGYADVRLVEDAGRKGIFAVDSMGEHEWAMDFTNDAFYLRRTGPAPMRANNSGGYLVESPVRLVAWGLDMEPYKLLACIASALGSNCPSDTAAVPRQVSTDPEAILKAEGLGPDVRSTILSRFQRRVLVAIDFTYIEDWQPERISADCDCNPCKTCDT